MVNWLLIAIILAIAAMIAITVPIAARGRRGRTEIGGDGRTGGRIVGAAIVIGWIVVVWVAGSTIYQAIAIGTGDWPVLVLTQPYWPQIPPNYFIGIDDATYGPGDTVIASGGFTEANAVIPHLSIGARVADIAAVVILGAAVVIAALVIIRLCRGLRAGQGLNGAGRMFGTLSLVALVGGFGWEIARQVGGSLAAHQIDLGGTYVRADDGFLWPAAADIVTVDFWPILPFLAFGALAAAFRYAERLQRDTEGLV